MESILEEVKKLDDATLREKLREVGIPVGPVTPGTKVIFQRRLAQRQFERKTGTKYIAPDAPASEASMKQSSAERKPSDGDMKQSDVFYAVCLPENTDPDLSHEVPQLVFSDKDLALKAAKRVKGSRFKGFKCETEAQQFARLTAESAFQSPKKLPKEEVKVSSESSPYKGPKPQEVTVLRRAIEKGDVTGFKEVVWNNPRYLVSSGDTPVMFQEGPRYTAMHVAALKNRPDICRVILDTLEDPGFVERLYCNSTNTRETQASRITFLVDLYLNMPDKGSCESPLHMACKFGFAGVVEVLAAHPKTDKNLRNKYGESPKDLICSRTPNSPATLKSKIEDLLKGQYYVPLIRTDDNSVPPVVGHPWSPDVSKSPLDIPSASWSPKDPNLSIKACAGPMSPDDANQFHKRWTTPPSNKQQAKGYFNAKRSDSEKGFERIGRDLAHEMQLPWKEYWEFLADFVDISSDDGLDTLEDYFSKRAWIMFIRDFKDRFGIHELPADIEEISTPVASRSLERDLDNCPLPVLDLDRKLRETGDPDDRGKEDDNVCGADGIVSPVTGLMQSFAKLKLDDSFSDQATVNTTQTVDITQESEIVNEEVSANKHEDEDTESKVGAKLNVNNNVIHDSPESDTADKKKGIAGQDLTDSNTPTDNKSCDTIEVSKTADSITPDDKSCDTIEVSKTADSNTPDNKSCDTIEVSKTVDSNKKDAKSCDTIEVSKTADTAVGVGSPASECSSGGRPTPPVQRLLSEGSESVSSYETAVEEAQDSSLSYVSDTSETAELPACIYLKDKNTFSTIRKFLCDMEISETNDNCHIQLILRLRPVTDHAGMTVDIVSIPELEPASDMLVLENVDVSSCIGEISSVQDGEEVEIRVEGGASGIEGGASEDDQPAVVHAYLTRARTLPKFGYIHGPQPTREDLDVCRALSDSLITPDSHPNVFNWKISMAKFVKDTNFKWQSPAKLKSSLNLQASPQSLSQRATSPLAQRGTSPLAQRGTSPLAQRGYSPLALRGTSPVISYGSPLGLSSRPAGRDSASDHLRTKLFPSILE